MSATTLIDKHDATEIWDEFTEAESGLEKVQDRRNWWVRNKELVPIAPAEHAWANWLADSGDFIFDPLPDTFFLFEAGLWIRQTRAEIREIINCRIREEEKDSGEYLEKALTGRHLDALVARLAGHKAVVKRDAFSAVPVGVILVANGRLQIDKSGRVDFDAGALGLREDLQQSRLPYPYDPTAKAPSLTAWLNRIFSDREDDVSAIAKMLGAGLWGSSRWKKMLVIYGKANLGKSQIPLLAERLIGRQRVAEFETRRLGEKFEMRRFVGKVLLRAEDVEADFMTRAWADTLKQLTGFGSLRVEGKNTHEEFELRGDKIIVATSNFRLRVRTDVDKSAWQERLVYLEADGEPYAHGEQDVCFLDTLFGSEAPGILNFALSGLRALLEDGWEKSEHQDAMVERVMAQGDSVADWARACTKPEPPDIIKDRMGLTIAEGWASYIAWSKENGVEIWPERVWREMAIEAIERIHAKSVSHSLPRGGTAQRGWRGLTL